MAFIYRGSCKNQLYSYCFVMIRSAVLLALDQHFLQPISALIRVENETLELRTPFLEISIEIQNFTVRIK